VRTAKALAVIVVALSPSLLSSAPASALSNAPDPGTWRFDGRVSAIVRSGGVVYVGGDFTSMTSGGTTLGANHAAAFDAATLQPTSWRPSINGSVYALATSSDGSIVYVGGSFTTVNGSSRTNFAAVGASGAGTVLSWKSNANSGVRAFVVSGSTLYMGGGFRKVQGGIARLGLAAIDGTTGALLPWAPAVTNPGSSSIPVVRGLARVGGDIVAVGKFTSANGPGEAPQSEPNQARFDAGSGARKPWADNYAFTSYGVVTDGTSYYVAGGGPGGAILRFDAGGKEAWRVHTDGDVQAIGLFQGQVVAGGHFLVTDGKDFPRLVAVSASGALDTSWRPNPNGTDSGTWAITGTAAGKLYVGGGFTAVNGSSSFQKFAQFSGTPVADTSPPTAPGSLAATAPSANRVNLTWTASSDDVGVAFYDLYRDGDPAPIASIPAASACSGTSCAASDTTVDPSTPYSYVARARDAAGRTSDPSNSAEVTTPASGGTPTTVTAASEADAMVKESNAASNFGTSTALRVDAGSDPDVESYLRFTVAGLSGGPVQSATLRVWTTSATQDGPAAYATSNGWIESGAGGITWNGRPGRTSGPSGDAAALPSGAWAQFDVTALVAGDGTYSFVLAGTSTDGVDFSSREGSHAPELVVTG